MKSLFTALLLGTALCTAQAQTAAPASAAKAPTAQQEKMKTCNAEAGDMKGDERKAFMSKCLSAKPETQQEKMARCSAANKGKKGDEYKAAQSECLKG